jgi:sugar diacid utilization regulator
MTLTEEQRLAIEIAVRYIPQWPSTRKERWIREALQAMIDSSDQFGEPTKLIGFDLEKPRVWQITEERVEALQDAIDRYDIYDRCLATLKRKMQNVAVLRAMLVEAGV